MSSTSTHTQLAKRISFFGLISLGAAGVIGSSWVYTNSHFFNLYGAGGEIFGLMVAVVIAVFIALSYAELSTTFPRAGGEVVYTYVAFGKTTSFIAGWALVGAYLSSLAFYVSASSLLLGMIFPGLAVGPGYTIAGVTMHLPELAIGIAITLIIFAFNYFGVSLTSRVQQVMFVAMIIIGIVLVVVGFSHGSPSNFWPAFTADQNPWTSIIRFILPAMTFLTGFELVAVMAEEANMPTKKIGICVILSIVCAGVFYVIVLLASAWVHPWTDTATNVPPMDMGTISAFNAEGFQVLGYAAYAVSALGLVTSFLGLFAATPRLMLSLSRANILPAAFAKTHPKYGTPTNALWLTLIFVLAFGWLGKGAIGWFLDMGGFTIAIAWVLTVASLIQIRRKYPQAKGAFRTPTLVLPAIGGLIAIAVAIAVLIPNTPLSLVWPAEYIILAVWIVAGVVLYMLRPKGNDQNNLRDLLGDAYSMIHPTGASASAASVPQSNSSGSAS